MREKGWCPGTEGEKPACLSQLVCTSGYPIPFPTFFFPAPLRDIGVELEQFLLFS